MTHSHSDGIKVGVTLHAEADHGGVEKGSHQRIRHLRVDFARYVPDLQQVHCLVDTDRVAGPVIGDGLCGL